MHALYCCKCILHHCHFTVYTVLRIIEPGPFLYILLLKCFLVFFLRDLEQQFSGAYEGRS